MEIVDKYISNYLTLVDSLERKRIEIEERLRVDLRNLGVICVVSSRVKDSDSLKIKLEKRYPEKNYQTLDMIDEDIVDLIGLRIALYFPSDLRIVKEYVHHTFNVKEIRQFPESTKVSNKTSKVFSGYHAEHYRIYEKNTQFSKVIEIQVASLLMHAWSEVEHDLAYKQINGAPSDEELESLDELNGLVLAAEIALQRIKRLTDIRFKSATISTHNQLVSILLEYFRDDYSIFELGNTEKLFDYFKYANILTKTRILNILEKVKFDQSQNVNLTSQIFDHLTLKNAKNFEIIHVLNKNYDYSNKNELNLESNDRTFLSFIKNWNKLEKVLNQILEARIGKVLISPQDKDHVLKSVLNNYDYSEYRSIKNIRNKVVRGDESIPLYKLEESTKEVSRIYETLTDKYLMEKKSPKSF